MEEIRVDKPDTGVQRATLLQTQPNCANGPVMIQALPQWIFPIFPVSTFYRAHKYSPAHLEQTLRRAEAIKCSLFFLCRPSSHLFSSTLPILSTFLLRVAVTDIVSYVS